MSTGSPSLTAVIEQPDPSCMDMTFPPSPVPPGATVNKIATDFQFTEGPLWHPDGFLIFSDIPANTVYRWKPQNGTVTQFLRPSGNSNGLSLDLNGHVLLCQHGKRRVARLESDGSETALATLYDGKKLNSPNDLTVSRDGFIFFTDPPYGSWFWYEGLQRELPQPVDGVYRIDPDTAEVTLVADELTRPNGLCFSPDFSKLYVVTAEAGAQIVVFDVDDDSSE